MIVCRQTDMLSEEALILKMALLYKNHISELTKNTFHVDNMSFMRPLHLCPPRTCAYIYIVAVVRISDPIHIYIYISTSNLCRPTSAVQVRVFVVVVLSSRRCKDRLELVPIKRIIIAAHILEPRTTIYSYVVFVPTLYLNQANRMCGFQSNLVGFWDARIDLENIWDRRDLVSDKCMYGRHLLYI